MSASIEHWLETERAQLPLWFVVAFGCGIGLWFALPGPASWKGVLLAAAALACAGFALPGTRTGRSMVGFGAAMAVGMALVWWRADHVAAPILARPLVVTFDAVVERVEPRAARDDVRLTLATATSGLPPVVRVTLANDKLTAGLGDGATIRIRARLQPPPPMALPGTHDYARDLWFKRIGAVGKALDPPQIILPARGAGLDSLRNRLGKHIGSRLSGGEAGIAIALATGDQAALDEDDADAMRRSGLAHLLSVSGLHIAAVVGAAMILSRRLLAISPRLALRFNLILVSAGFGALAGIGYTLLTGMQVPTVRSCIAALMVLAGIALGREAISLRLVAVGALVILSIFPESLVGASFQMSFAAVTAIIALHSFAPLRKWFMPRDDGLARRVIRGVGGLILTGLAVEIALMPFALYHFHKAGLYGVAANLIVIPLTTFVIMPLEAGALLLDAVGLGQPLWIACGWALGVVLDIAHAVGSAKGAVTMIPSMPVWAFATMVLGGAWVLLWATRQRWWGLVPVAIGAIAAILTPAPDLLITGDGEHLALVRDDGVPVLLRPRSGDFVRDMMSEVSAYDGDPLDLDTQSFARCTADSCVADIVRDGRAWRVLAIRSRNFLRWDEMVTACADADIVVADRRLPQGCTPRWLKLDRQMLAQTGGVAIGLQGKPNVRTVAASIGHHPWRPPPQRTATPQASDNTAQ